MFRPFLFTTGAYGLVLGSSLAGLHYSREYMLRTKALKMEQIRNSVLEREEVIATLKLFRNSPDVAIPYFKENPESLSALVKYRELIIDFIKIRKEESYNLFVTSQDSLIKLHRTVFGLEYENPFEGASKVVFSKLAKALSSEESMHSFLHTSSIEKIAEISENSGEIGEIVSNFRVEGQSETS